MALGNISEVARTLGYGQASTRLTPPVGAGGPVKAAFGAMETIQRGQARADMLAASTQKIIKSPVVQASLRIPTQHERPVPQWIRTATSIAGAVPRPSAAAGAASLPGRNFPLIPADGTGRLPETATDLAHGWRSPDLLGGHGRIAAPPSARGLATNQKVPNLVSAGMPLLPPGVGDRFRTFHSPHAMAGLFDLPILGGIGKLVRGYLGFSRHLDGLITGWRRFGEGLLKQARRAWELYPRDSEGRPIPPWNLRLYFLAWRAYRLDDYEILAGFLDEIGADDSPDNVLFVRPLLAPTFDPKRPDRRTNWWLLDPSEARHALRKRLENIRRGGDVEPREGELSYREDPEDDENPGDSYWSVVKRAPHTISAERVFFDHELPTLLLQELAVVLPSKQHEVVSLASRGWTYERIAREMNITVGAVKAHMHKVRNNPLVADILLPRLAPRSEDAQILRRTHRG